MRRNHRRGYRPSYALYTWSMAKVPFGRRVSLVQLYTMCSASGRMWYGVTWNGSPPLIVHGLNMSQSNHITAWNEFYTWEDRFKLMKVKLLLAKVSGPSLISSPI